MKRSNKMLSTLMGMAAAFGLGGGGFGARPEPLPPLSSPQPSSPFPPKKVPRSINGRVKQKRCGNVVLRYARKWERQNRRQARRMKRR